MNSISSYTGCLIDHFPLMGQDTALVSQYVDKCRRDLSNFGRPELLSAGIWFARYVNLQQQEFVAIESEEG